MAQFKPFQAGVEVNGQTVMAVVNGVSELYKEKMLNVLAKHGIIEPLPNVWYKQEAWLKAFDEISQSIGIYTLFSIGKSIPESADFPPDIRTLEDALRSIDVAYHMNHRGGEIGHYTLTYYDDKERKAIMECNNPYPCHFDRGIILSITRRFRPKDSIIQDVVLDLSKQGRLDGGDTSTYVITW